MFINDVKHKNIKSKPAGVCFLYSEKKCFIRNMFKDSTSSISILNGICRVFSCKTFRQYTILFFCFVSIFLNIVFLESYQLWKQISNDFTFIIPKVQFLPIKSIYSFGFFNLLGILATEIWDENVSYRSSNGNPCCFNLFRNIFRNTSRGSS